MNQQRMREFWVGRDTAEVERDWRASNASHTPYLCCEAHWNDVVKPDEIETPSEIDTVELTAANRLLVADLEIAKMSVVRASEAMRKNQEILDEARDRLHEIKSGGLEPYLRKIRSSGEDVG